MTTLEHTIQHAYLDLCHEILTPVSPIPADVLNELQLAIRALQMSLAYLNEENYVPVTQSTRH